MSVEATEGNDGDDDLFGYASWSLRTGIWDGRPISLADAPYFQNEVEQKITAMLFSQHPDSIGFQQLAAQLAWIGTEPGERSLLARDIEALDFSSNALILQAGLGKSLSKFWKKHKVAILVGIGILSVVTVVAAVAICSTATATGAAAAGGASLGELKKGEPEKKTPSPEPKAKLADDHPPPIHPQPLPKVVHDEILFFEKGFMVNDQYCTYDDLQKRSYYEAFASSIHSNPTAFLGLNIPGKTKSEIDQILSDLSLLLQPRPLVQDELADSSSIVRSEFCCRIGGINGMNNKAEEASLNKAHLLKFIPYQKMEWVYNRTHGPFIDLCEVFFLNYGGSSPNTAQELQANWQRFHEDNKDNPHAKYLQFCHSQGAIHVKNALKNAPKEIRDRVIVIAIAPGAIIPKNLCYSSFNYASKGDIVPYGALFATCFKDYPGDEWRLAEIEKIEHELQELILLDPHPNSKNNHNFMSPTFDVVIEESILDYLDHNGEYP